MFIVKQLYDLQLLDWDIQEREKSLADIRARLANDSKRIGAKQRLDKITTRQTELGTPRRKSEGVIQQVESRLENIDRRIYSGMVTNPRELEAFEEEKSNLQRQRSDEEDSLLEVLVEIEELQAEEIQANQAYDTINSTRESEIIELQSDEDTLTQEMPDLVDQREDMAAEYPPIAMATYNLVKGRRRGQAVALVERGACQGCRLTLPSTELQKVRSTQDIVQCSSCTRILVIT
jgi:predicted  nucleic acid-binding Zn-ribbon protein